MFTDCRQIWDLGLCDLSHKISKSWALFSCILENLVVIPTKMLGHCTPNGVAYFMCSVIQWQLCAWPCIWVQSEPDRHDSCLGVHG